METNEHTFLLDILDF